MALGDTPGELPMVMPIINNVKMQGLSHIQRSGHLDTGSEITVKVEKLDNITELMTANKVSGIKIDVENFEYFALKGGEALLSKFKPIIYCELWKNEQRTQTIDYLKTLGYNAKVFDQGELVSFDKQDTINFFFIYSITS
jgi:hypothetical protein